MTRTGSIGCVLMMLAVSCGDAGADSLASEDASGRRDAGAPMPPPGPPPGDPIDAGPAADGSQTPTTGTDAGLGPTAPGPMDGVREDWAMCGDRDAEEEDGAVDCESSACTTAPLCCADAEACCIETGAALSVPFDGCAAGGLDAACLGDFDVLGETAPALLTDGTTGALWLAPAGPNYVALGSRTTFDPSTALDAAMTVATRASCPTGACQEMVGVGLAPLGSTSPDDAVLSAVLSVATGQLVLMSHGEVVRRAPVDVGAPTSGRLSIAIDAAGDAVATFEMDRGIVTSVRASDGARSTQPLRMIAFGRGENAREARIVVRGLSARTRVCDRPAAWVIEPVAVTNGRELRGAWTALAVAHGVGASGPEQRFAVQAGGRIYTGRMEADGLTFQTGDGGALSGVYGDGTSSESLGGLVYLESAARWELFVARAGLDIVRIPSSTGASFDRAVAEPVLTLAAVAAASAREVVAIDQPTVAVDWRGYTTLAYRLRDADGQTWIGSAQSYGDGFFRIDTDSLQPSERAESFDRDGVGTPALIVYSELTNLYYAGRRGVASSVGLARRTPAGGWERYDERLPVLSPGIEPWRTFGVGSPAAALRSPDGASATLDVFFLATGTDGVSLQRAHREVPWLGL